MRSPGRRSWTPAERVSTGARLAWLACALCASGCGGSQASTRASDQGTYRPGELAMRDPQRRGAGGTHLGELQPVAVPARPEPAKGPPQRAREQGPPPIRIATEKGAKAVPLQGRDLVLPDGLIIHDVRKGVTARTVQEQGTGDSVLELLDARGRRLALLKQIRLSRVALRGGPLLDATAETHERGRRRDWGAGGVRVVIDRFRHESRLYTLERRADGTDWIWSGLELSSHPASAGAAR